MEMGQHLNGNWKHDDSPKNVENLRKPNIFLETQNQCWENQKLAPAPTRKKFLAPAPGFSKI